MACLVGAVTSLAVRSGAGDNVDKAKRLLAASDSFASFRSHLDHAILDAAAITLSAIDIPYEASAALCLRSGFLCFRRVANYFDIPNPQDPRYPNDSISITREEFDSVLDQLSQAGVPIKPDREKVWLDFAGWRVNYDRTLLVLCPLVMTPPAAWSSDRAPALPPLVLYKKHRSRAKDS